MQITHVTSEVFEWERPGIRNGSHFYGYGSLHPKLSIEKDGTVAVPDRPGIGFDLNMDLLGRYRVG